MEVVGDVLVDDCVAGVWIEERGIGQSSSPDTSFLGPEKAGKELREKRYALCPPAARQHSVACCDSMSVIFPLPARNQRLQFRPVTESANLHPPIDCLIRW